MQRDPSILEFIFKSIKQKTIDELLDLNKSLYKISLKEMIIGFNRIKGISPDQLNSLPIDFIKNEYKNNLITEQDLKNGGLSDEKLKEIFGNNKTDDSSIKTSTDEPSTQILNDPPIPPRPIIIDRILKNDVSLNEIQNALNQGEISDIDLININFNEYIIDRVKNYEPQTPYMPKVEELPRLREGATDIYFLGLPGTGKSTMLASLLTYMNRNGMMRRTMDNPHGTKYLNQLIAGFIDGFLPDSTPKELINYIPIDLKNPFKQSAYHKLNLIDIAGEKFKAIANQGASELKKYKDYLANKNRKCLIFLLDYYEQTKFGKINFQDQNLQDIFAFLLDFGILQNTEMIYLIVTKADRFPTQEKFQFTKEYIDNNYLNFLNRLIEERSKYDYVIKALPFSIGATKLVYLLEDNNPRTNTNLEDYPSRLVNQIIEDSGLSNKGWF
jgi:hypothetical protein